MATAAEHVEVDRILTLGLDDTPDEWIASSSGIGGSQAPSWDLDGTLAGPPEPLMASSPTRGTTRVPEVSLPCASACQPAEVDQERGKL